MTGRRRIAEGFRVEKLVAFLEASYDFSTDDQGWLVAVMEAASAVFGRGSTMHGAVYDASDVTALRLLEQHVGGFSPEGVGVIIDGIGLVTPPMVARSFRSSLIATVDDGFPEMAPMYEGLARFGLVDTLYLNGLDPSGRGVMMGLWSRERLALRPAERTVYRRMAHHLSAAYRCRRRLAETQTDRSAIDMTQDAPAVLDARKRIVHATGAAQTKSAQRQLQESSAARERAMTSRRGDAEELRAWRALAAARWTLVDSFERSGTRYVVARENPTRIAGLARLSERERQVVAYAAIGQSTKETAYALGISDTTVRVLLLRAANKLGVASRTQLLEHPEVKALAPRIMRDIDR